MVDTFTTLQIVRYVYKECEATEKLVLDEFIQNDFEARQELRRMTTARNMLPEVLFSAHPKSLETILTYSRKAVSL
ncbi:MAG: hypothetical protein IPM92_15955 [Saprospiraceae bacterium]|nr:hypothetical protein [Saprospiraceae bacterium]